MKIVACLSWYEESPVWLASLVASCHGLADHFVAVDGAYFLYPDALRHPVSGPEQAEAIVQTAKALGIGCTIHVPNGPWLGNETEKRSFLFRLANTVATPGDDWLLVVDGDDIVDSAPYDVKKRLDQAETDVAEVSLWWREDWEATGLSGDHLLDEWSAPHRRLFRADPSLRCGYAHNIIETDIGRLRGPIVDETPLEPALSLLELRVEHRHAHRSRERQRAAAEFGRLRDEHGIEQPAVAD